MVLVVLAFSSASAFAEPFRLLDSDARWMPVSTSSDVFTIADDQLTARRRSNESATVVTRDDYENFELSFDFLVRRWCELALLIHAPRYGLYSSGLEISLTDSVGDGSGPYTAGAILGIAAPAANAINASDLWNSCVVRMDWPRLAVTINGTLVQDRDLDADEALKYKLRRGPIGFRDLLGWGFEVRDMEIAPLPNTEGGIELFDGKGLARWKEVRKGTAVWSVADQAIVGKDGNGYLQYEKLVQDFDLRLYYRATPTANGGVFFRWMTDDSDRGNEIQILDVPETEMTTGSIYGIARADGTALRPDEWRLMQISVRGPSAVTLLNGVRVAQTNALTKVRPGHITLQMHKENSTIEFRDLVLVPRD